MDDWEAVRTKENIEVRNEKVQTKKVRSQQVTVERVRIEKAILAQQAARNHQLEDLLDKEIELIRRIMLKVSQRKISESTRSSGSSNKMKTETGFESAASGAKQQKIWRPGEK